MTEHNSKLTVTNLHCRRLSATVIKRHYYYYYYSLSYAWLELPNGSDYGAAHASSINFAEQTTAEGGKAI